MSSPPQSPITLVGKLVSVIPVGLKEAALDSPTFRATTLHFAEQVDSAEKWLDGYVKSTGKLASEASSLEGLSNSFLSHVITPINVSEAVLDHDYSLLAMKRYSESVKDFWSGVIATLKKADTLISDPVRAFVQGDLRSFKETRRALDQSQKHYDNLQARYASQTKSKEPSSLREDAFQLHEARKAYLKVAMDFCVQAPQLKNSLDKLLVNIFFDQWREFRVMRDNSSSIFTKWGQEMDRIKGWTHEIESSEKSSRRELLAARKQIEEAAELAVRPSRELEDYAVSTVPFLGTQGPASLRLAANQTFRPEKQGWLNLRILAGKPTRTVWVRRWAFLRSGIFGCLVQGPRTGGVEESERIGVLLCSIRPAFQEERRFCFEVKTKSNTIMLQAETQKELTEWIGSFEAAKRKALENPSPRFSAPGKPPVQDPAFAISQPAALEFAADISDSLTPNANDEASVLDRSATLTVLDRDGFAVRNSGDFTGSRRLTGLEKDGESGRDHASRIIQKLDIRKSATGIQPPGSASPQLGTGGIASLISASHSLLPLGSNLPISAVENETTKMRHSQTYGFRDVPPSTLAPLTLVNPPAPTSMSRVAVVVNCERGIGAGLADSTGAVSSGVMANLWGSSNWGLINKLEQVESLPSRPNDLDEQLAHDSFESPPSTIKTPPTRAPTARHRQTISLDGDAGKFQTQAAPPSLEYPSYYPPQLKQQDAQFRLLFPHTRDESLVLVFRATFSPDDQQEFPGRSYVTTRHIYFYSNYFGLVLTSCVNLDSISEVTAAPGRDCDFLFLHINPEAGSDISGRITIKTFLEPLKLLQRRLNFLIKDADAEAPLDLGSIFKTLLKMELDGPIRTPSMDSWEDVSLNTPADDGAPIMGKPEKVTKAGFHVDKDFNMDSGKSGRRGTARFRLPAQPVEYVPQGILQLSAQKVFDISPKALFHVLFGDKSAVWQLLQHQRRAQNIKQGPWTNVNSGHMKRSFEYQIEVTDLFGRPRHVDVSDYQIVDVFNDYLCYVVTDKRTPWHLPFKRYFRLVSKIVITHISKSRCKLAIFTKVEWLWHPSLIRYIIDKQATSDLEQDALDLVDLVTDQVRRLGAHHQTSRAISMFGHVGRQTHVSQFTGGAAVLKSQLRRPQKPNGLLPMLLETTGSLLQSAVSSLMIWLFALVRWIWKTSSANSVILSILCSSLLINGFFSYRETFGWWQERNASNLMSRLGIRPNNILSKAVYIRDMDDVIANSTFIGMGNSSTCFSIFRENNMLRDPDTPLTLTTPSSRDTPSKTAAYRLRRTLQRLGSYRHDLLVALRVVNSVEKEVLKAEWERWLRQETRRCHMIKVVLNDCERKNDDDCKKDAFGVQKRFLRKEDIKHWYEDYCLSCQQEQQRVE